MAATPVEAVLLRLDSVQESGLASGRNRAGNRTRLLRSVVSTVSSLRETQVDRVEHQ